MWQPEGRRGPTVHGRGTRGWPRGWAGTAGTCEVPVPKCPGGPCAGVPVPMWAVPGSRCPRGPAAAPRKAGGGAEAGELRTRPWGCPALPGPALPGPAAASARECQHQVGPGAAAGAFPGSSPHGRAEGAGTRRDGGRGPRSGSCPRSCPGAFLRGSARLCRAPRERCRPGALPVPEEPPAARCACERR